MFDFALQTPTLFLRPFCKNDADACRTAMAELPEDDIRNMCASPLGDCQQLLEYLVASHCELQPDLFEIAIKLDRHSPFIIGGISVFETPEERIYPGIQNESASFGIWMSPRHRGRGLAKEAMSIVMKLCFEWTDVNFIQGDCFEANRRSVSLLQRSMSFYKRDSYPYQGQTMLSFIQHRQHPDFDYDRCCGARRPMNTGTNRLDDYSLG